VQIAKAWSHAPHQADDKIYYKRRDATRLAMDDYEVRDAMRRSIEAGRKYGTAWNLLVELRRLQYAMSERIPLGNDHMSRDRLIIRVSQDLRSMGDALLSLEKNIRNDVANLVVGVDRFNAVIETVDPAQRDEARMNEPLREKLRGMRTIADGACASLERFIAEAP
jgi:hypothetical protein